MSINKDISPENYLTDYLELAGKNKKNGQKHTCNNLETRKVLLTQNEI